MKKQTAVEWLQEAITKKLTSELGPYFLELFENAKAMEKEQHQQTATHFFPTSLKKNNFEQYYNQTFK